MPITILSGAIKYKKNGNFNALDCIKGDPATGPVQDVQVNGTSILNNGVANIPYASTSEYGLVKRGRGLFNDSSTGALVVDFGDSGQIKQGTNTNAVMSIVRQHESAFYGLAKVAGADLAGQTVTLGQYPEPAQAAIQKMIGVYESPWELINEITATEDLTQMLISTDSYGEPFELEKAICLFEAGVSTTGNRNSFYGQYQFINPNNGWHQSDSFPSLIYPTATSTMGARIDFDTNKGTAPITIRTITAVGDGNTQNVTSMAKKNIVQKIISVRIYQSNANSSLIPAGAKMTLYGKRVPT